MRDADGGPVLSRQRFLGLSVAGLAVAAFPVGQVAVPDRRRTFLPADDRPFRGAALLELDPRQEHHRRAVDGRFHGWERARPRWPGDDGTLRVRRRKLDDNGEGFSPPAGRSYARLRPPETLPTGRQVGRTLKLVPYDVKPWDFRASTQESFRANLEVGAHSRVH